MENSNPCIYSVWSLKPLVFISRFVFPSCPFLFIPGITSVTENNFARFFSPIFCTTWIIYHRNNMGNSDGYRFLGVPWNSSHIAGIVNQPLVGQAKVLYMQWGIFLAKLIGIYAAPPVVSWVGRHHQDQTQRPLPAQTRRRRCVQTT